MFDYSCDYLSISYLFDNKISKAPVGFRYSLTLIFIVLSIDNKS